MRDLARRCNLKLVELNFEREPGNVRLFADPDPRRVLDELSLALDCEIDPATSLLFLDEIQAVPELLGKLRWFAEELPELAVVAAGSLLELALANQSFSMPVGRIGYCYLEPMGFNEYLTAHGQLQLLERLQAWRPPAELSPVVAEKASNWFHRYAMVGGMPAVAQADVDGADGRQCRRLQRDLVATYREDFAKYSGRIMPGVLDAVLRAVVSSLGRKFVYARVGEGVKQHQVKQALELLAQARLCHLVVHSHANGLPLGGEVKNSFRKALLLDVGLLHALLNTPAANGFPRWEALSPHVRGQLIEQVDGQQLRLLADDPSQAPEVYYWQREGGRPAEIDFLVQMGTQILPVELKSGAAGSMKSLHQLVHDKRLECAVRLYAGAPTLQHLDLRTTQGHRVRYRLLSVPHYLAWNLSQLGLSQCLEDRPA